MVLYGKLYNARWSPGSSLRLTGRIHCQMRFTLFDPCCVHQRTTLPTKECFIMLGDLSMELPFRRGWNQALFKWNAMFEIRTSPWLTKQNYWKSTPAMPMFVWMMDEKQLSRFVIFHLEVFMMPLHQVFPSSHPIMTIDLLTTAVRQMKKTRKILFLQTIRLETTKVSLLQETMDITRLLKHQRTLVLQLFRCDARHACTNPSIDMGLSDINNVLLHVSCYLRWCAFACIELRTKMCYCVCRFSCRGGECPIWRYFVF